MLINQMKFFNYKMVVLMIEDVIVKIVEKDFLFVFKQFLYLLRRIK